METEITQQPFDQSKKDWKFVLIWLFRIILSGVFIYAGILKLIEPADFAGAIATFQLIPESWSNLVAFTLPPYEVILGILILTPFGVRPASLGLILLNGVFLIALLQGLVRGLPVDCGCFGSSGPSTPMKIWMVIARDVLFWLMAWMIRRTRNE